MNNARRKEITKAITMVRNCDVTLAEASGIIEQARDEEQEALDNLPEGLRNSEKGSEMEQNVSALEDAITALEPFCSIADDLEGAIV